MTRPYDPNHPAFSHALEQVRPELDALPGDKLEDIRVDIVAAIVLALGVAPAVKRLRAAIAAQLGDEAARHIDRLETTARACGRAHALYLTTLGGDDVEQMVAELGRTRRVLRLEAESLIARKELPGSVLGELVGGTGYQAMCLDTLQIVSALRGRWGSIEGHTTVTTAELDRAEALADAVATTLGENQQAGSGASPAAELRRRAYTLFVRTYDEVRRLVSYIRWTEDDADEIAPSLFSGRGRRRSDDAEPATPASAAAGPAIAPGMPGAAPFAVTGAGPS